MTVEKFNRPAVRSAFDAWLQLFVPKHEVLSGADGGEWALSRELTWEVFLTCVRSARRGKAVGPGGFSSELLRDAPEAVLKTIYEALMEDVRRGVVSESWKRVVYVLLVKKPPNNPNLISERRDIALMAQDMKLLLKMVRETCYKRIARRVLSDQVGWVAGLGAFDPGLSAANVIQQVRELGGVLYLLYIDLATFFPMIERGVLNAAEVWHGVPDDVRELTARIFGAVDNDEDGMRCQYDTAAGLSEYFRNSRGALMGCVLSPDRAKILLNSMVMAIHLHVKGVRVWGSGGDGGDLWKQIVQLAYADDWLGCFERGEEVKKAWALWSVWEQATGNRLGIKMELKTVLSGVCWREGVACAPPEVVLVAADGRRVPFMSHEEAYKYLGLCRRADGNDAAAWATLMRNFDAAIARLRRVRSNAMTMDEFVLVSDSLLGGLAEFYLRSLYITREQAEQVERKWRRVYNARCQRDSSTPRALLYGKGAIGRGRRHVWSVGIAALFDCMTTAMSDMHESAQRVSTRAAVARRAAVWGCRQDPLSWSSEHVTVELEAYLDKQECRWLGDAYWLAAGVLNAAAAKDEDPVRGGRCCLQATGALPLGDPLREECEHFTSPSSTLVFEPVKKGGLGMVAVGGIIRAQCVAVEDFCSLARAGQDAEWLYDFEEACDAWPLAENGVDENTWLRVVCAVASVHEPVSPSARRGCVVAAGTPEVIWSDGSAAECARRLQAVASRLVMVAAGDAPDPGAAEWVGVLRSCFTYELKVPEPSEWDSGGWDPLRVAGSARVVVDLGGEPTRLGGRSDWLADDEVGEDGYLAGWRERLRRFRRAFEVDNGGFVCWRPNESGTRPGSRVTVAEATELPVMIALFVQSRWAVGDVRLSCGPPVKCKDTFVNVDVARDSFDKCLELTAKVAPSFAGTGDASFDVIRNEKGGVVFKELADGSMVPAKVVARAAGLPCGGFIGAVMEEPEGNDNYLGELAALMDVLRQAPPGGVVVIVFDATSPVHALLKFVRAGSREKQRYYGGEWLEELWRLIQRQRLVWFWWQTSHVGAPLNEWADLLADEAKALPAVAVSRGPVTFASLRWAGARGGVHEWASRRASEVTSGWLASFMSETPARGEGEIRLKALPPRVFVWADRVLSARAHAGDDKWRRRAGRLCRDADVRCPFGCADEKGAIAFSWLHVHAFCKGCDEVVEARSRWSTLFQQVKGMLVAKGGSDSTAQMQLSERVVGAAADWVSGAALPAVEEHAVAALREVAGALVVPGEAKKSSIDRDVVWKMVVAGLEIHVAAEEASEHFTRGALSLMGDRRLLKRMTEAWRTAVVKRGPARAAAVARVANDARAAQLALVGDPGWRHSLVAFVGGSRELVCRSAETYCDLSEMGRLSSVSRRIATGWYMRMWFARWASIRRAGDGIWVRGSTDGLVALASAAAGVGVVSSMWEAGIGGLAGARGVEWRSQHDDYGMARVDAGAAWRRAWKQWAMTGGWAAMAAERSWRASSMDIARDVARARNARGTLSVKSFLPLIAMEVRRRVWHNAAIAEGLEADGRGRWAVDDVLEWRGASRDQDGRDTREALVRWLGFNRVTGEPWADQWIPRRLLTTDLRGQRKRVPRGDAAPPPKRERCSTTRGSTLRGGGSKLARGVGDSAGFVVAERKRSRRGEADGNK